jgi:protease I
VAEDDLTGKTVAIVATDYYEEAELVKPLTELRRAGATVEVIAPHPGDIRGLNHVDPANTVPVDKTLDEADSDDYDAVVLPGGVVNADHLRIDENAQDFVCAMYEASKPVAAMCHAPWLLISANLVKGKQLTSYKTLKDDLVNAGAEWRDEAVVVDENLITSRKPDDLPQFIGALKEQLSGV